MHRIHRKAANVSGSSKAKVESGLKHKAKMCTVHRYMGFRKSNPVKLKLYPHKDICGRYEKPAKCAETKTQVHNAHLPRFIFHQLVELGFSFVSHWSQYLHTGCVTASKKTQNWTVSRKSFTQKVSVRNWHYETCTKCKTIIWLFHVYTVFIHVYIH